MRQLTAFSAVIALSLVSSAIAQADTPPHPSAEATNEANNPLTSKITVNFQDYYIPSFNKSDKEANQFLLRGIVPSDLFGLKQLFRFTMPTIVTSPRSPMATTRVSAI